LAILACYKHPQGTVAYEVNAAASGIPHQQCGSGGSPGNVMQMPGMEVPMPSDGGHQHRHWVSHDKAKNL
jgi:hypothetical protein